jgi:hypothetical protein
MRDTLLNLKALFTDKRDAITPGIVNDRDYDFGKIRAYDEVIDSLDALVASIDRTGVNRSPRRAHPFNPAKPVVSRG